MVNKLGISYRRGFMMKKLLALVVLILGSFSYVLSAVDEISQCIELLQPEKLKQIFSHNVVLKNVDKQKYLDQINNKIERLKMAREKSERIDPIRIMQAKYVDRGTSKSLGGLLVAGVGLSSLIAVVWDTIPFNQKLDPTRFLSMCASSLGIATGAYFFANGLSDIFKFEMLEKHFNSAFKKAYFVKALLEEVVAV